MIFRSASKTFTRRAFRTFVVQITSRTRFPLLLSDPFEFFFFRVVVTSTKSALCLEKFALSLFLPQLDLLSRFRESVCKDKIYKDFWSVKISSLLNYAWWLDIWAEYFPLWWNLSRNMCMNWSSEYFFLNWNLKSLFNFGIL